MLIIADLLAQLPSGGIGPTFASPVNVQPAKLGFDITLHSATKYLNGHSDLIAGVVLGGQELIKTIRVTANVLGPAIDPHSCFLLSRGLRTLGLRVEQQDRNGEMVPIESLDRQKLVGRVLQWLKPKDLCNARQAARLFDRASRLETDSFSALKLRPDSILSGHYAPDFSRFPLLARLYLKDPYNQRAPDQLRWCFAVADRPSPRRDAACAVLAALGELDGRDWGISGPTDLATVLRHMPGITSLRLNLCTQSAEEALTRLAILPALVPRIERLELLPSCMGRVESDFDKHCARIIGSLPCLRLLLMGSFKDASVLATLPCSRLTSLEFAVETCQHWPPLGCDVGLPWPHLRELRGIDLPAGDWAERLALGLPHLTLLVAEPSGDWGTHAPAAFPKVRAAMFTFCQRGFRRLCLRSLVPDVDFLEVMFDDDAVLVEISTTALSGLTRLSHLAYDNMHKGFLPLWLC
ncbi:cystathionine gamma-synthase [Monoraphidium neglectum]|uniref:Cystathionine gamma-synthase n=1 Tax=Monoraphidium neglectum TaxID=145388 RepID=A0A0D2MEA8_9CHLO|nr:cystathionine gamma-synthase [Monoraphidium neglectum]KIY99061.1 cystathionine gamma-synthase [Monoraphidium neglectum]|eukprot:XP_013898081.1 cystathionine gamma-synthase [Monoraphidium neglectum]